MVCVRLAPTFKNLNCGNGVLESNIKKRKKVQTEYMSKSTTYSTQLFMQMYGEVFLKNLVHRVFCSKHGTGKLNSFPGSSLSREKYPGLVWSRVTYILGANK